MRLLEGLQSPFESFLPDARAVYSTACSSAFAWLPAAAPHVLPQRCLVREQRMHRELESFNPCGQASHALPAVAVPADAGGVAAAPLDRQSGPGIEGGSSKGSGVGP